jgi:3-oxoacyl-[acyl-carrier protein] reductase
MDLGLTGRSALVFGASGGLGLASAESLAEEGARVAIVARNAEKLEAEAARIGALAIPGDVRESADIERAVRTTVDTYGGLDIVVANGGGPPTMRASEITPEDIEVAFRLLLLPIVQLVQASLPYLKSSGRGRLVLIASMSVREPLPNLALSNAIRPGVVGYMKTLSTELAEYGITVNSVAPGRLSTNRTMQVYGGAEPPPEQLETIPMKRFGRPRELGDVVAFLCSEQASYVSGSLISIDGGLTRSLT